MHSFKNTYFCLSTGHCTRHWAWSYEKDSFSCRRTDNMKTKNKYFL